MGIPPELCRGKPRCVGGVGPRAGIVEAVTVPGRTDITGRYFPRT